MFILLLEGGGGSESVWFGCRRILGQRLLYNVVSSLFKVNNYIFATQCGRLWILQTRIIWICRIYSLKYKRSTTLGSEDIKIRNPDLVEKTHFLWFHCTITTLIWFWQKQHLQLKGWKIRMNLTEIWKKKRNYPQLQDLAVDHLTLIRVGKVDPWRSWNVFMYGSE